MSCDYSRAYFAVQSMGVLLIHSTVYISYVYTSKFKTGHVNIGRWNSTHTLTKLSVLGMIIRAFTFQRGRHKDERLTLSLINSSLKTSVLTTAYKQGKTDIETCEIGSARTSYVPRISTCTEAQHG